MVERLVRTGLLYDFYGGLLTEKQQRVMELYFLENWSLAEIAANEGVSRQAVHDLLQRSEKTIEGFEAKLGLLERFSKQQALLTGIRDQLQQILNNTIESNEPLYRKIAQIKDQVTELIELEN